MLSCTVRDPWFILCDTQNNAHYQFRDVLKLNIIILLQKTKDMFPQGAGMKRRRNWNIESRFLPVYTLTKPPYNNSLWPRGDPGCRVQ